MAHNIHQWRPAIERAEEYANYLGLGVEVETYDSDSLTLAIPGRGSFTVPAACLEHPGLLDAEIAAGVAGACQPMVQVA